MLEKSLKKFLIGKKTTLMASVKKKNLGSIDISKKNNFLETKYKNFFYTSCMYSKNYLFFKYITNKRWAFKF